MEFILGFFTAVMLYKILVEVVVFWETEGYDKSIKNLISWKDK